MTPETQQRIAANLARIMALLCLRNTQLEALHAGLTPVTRTGDYSDVFVVDAEGRHIPWTDVSRIDDAEMRALMQEVVNRIYTFHLCADDPKLRATIERWQGAALQWDAPEIDPRMISEEIKPQ
jgi:hypothetical protein